MTTTTLTVNGIDLYKPGAWELDDSIVRIPPLGGKKKRSTNQPMPYVHGDIPGPQWLGPAVCDLVLEVFGELDHAGASHPDIATGKRANLLYLSENLDSVDSITMAGVLTMDSDDYVADVQIENWTTVNNDALAVVTFDLIIPAGTFVPEP